MIRTRLLTTACAVLALTVLATGASAAPDHAPPRTARADRVSDPGGLVAEDLRARAGYDGDGTFTGIDGIVYQSAPVVVEGKFGQLFWGPDFDVACSLGTASQVNFAYTTKLARLIEKSGRTAIWTAAPNKANVYGSALPDPLPHGTCDADGIGQQKDVIDRLDRKDPTFLPLRNLLARDDREVYFKTDLHWTTVGGSVFAQAVAERLDPRVARRQRYTYGTETRVGILNYFRDSTAQETAQTAIPATGTKVNTDRGSVEQWDGYPNTVLDYSWNAGPAKKTIGGHTLLLGDSFMLYALESMRPIFRHGHFMFLNHVSERDVIRAIKASDTVVMETLQTFASFESPLIHPGFRKKLRKALLKH